MKRWSLLIIAFMLVFSLACLGSNSTATPDSGSDATVEATEEAPDSGDEETAEPEETTEPEETEAVSSGSLDLSEINSYRSRTTILIESDGKVSEMSIEQEEIREPRAQHQIIKSSGDESPTGDTTMETLVVDGKNWMNINGMWMQTEQTDPIPAFGKDMAPFTDDPENDSDFSLVGEETVNGIKTQHYHGQTSKIAEGLSALGASSISKGEGDVWIAVDGNLPRLPIKVNFMLEGSDENGKPVKITVTQELYDINADFEITVPEEATESGLPDDIPSYEGASEFASFGTMVTFSTTDDVATVAKFYEEQMAAQGWTLASNSDMGGTVMQTWEKDDRKVDFIVSSADGKTSVMITLGEK